MPSPVSTIPQVKAFLFALFTTQAATIPAPPSDEAGLLVTYAEPAQYQPEDIIAFGGVKRTIRPHGLVGTGGAGALEEEYAIEVIVAVYRGSDLAQYTDERAYTILAVMEQGIRADPSLGGLVIWAWPGVSESIDSFDENHMGRETTIRLEVNCLAII